LGFERFAQLAQCDSTARTSASGRSYHRSMTPDSRFSGPGLQVQDYHEELLVDLLNRRPGHSVHDYPEWFGDANPEAYLELVDLGLVDGIEYSSSEISVGDVRLTDKGRRVAEAARRRLGIRSIGVFVSYVHDDSAVVDQLCADLESAGVRTWRDVDQLLAVTTGRSLFAVRLRAAWDSSLVSRRGLKIGRAHTCGKSWCSQSSNFGSGPQIADGSCP
jgi:hypothetical protein